MAHGRFVGGQWGGKINGDHSVATVIVTLMVVIVIMVIRAIISILVIRVIIVVRVTRVTIVVVLLAGQGRTLPSPWIFI